MGIPLDQWSGAAATNELHEIIKEFNEVSSKQTQQMIYLTWAIVGLTVLMLIGLLVQIIIQATS